MAEVAYTQQRVDGPRGTPVGELITWTPVTNADTFQAYSLDQRVSDLCFSYGGTHDGATLVINGGDGTRSGPTNSLTGVAAWTADACFSLAERPRSIAPATSGGGGSQSVGLSLMVWY